MAKTTLLTIGDLTTDGIKKEKSLYGFIRHRKNVIRKGVNFKFITYEDLLRRRLPDVTTKKLKAMLFFPYAYWNERVERYDLDDRIYGDANFGRDTKKLFLEIRKILESTYKDKDVIYVNPPYTSIIDRDKRKTAGKLRKQGILTPKIYNISNIDQLDDILKKAGALYIKPAFGAMGKGMSFINRDECWTNFIFREGEIISRPRDYNWGFSRISEKRRNAFLKILIRRKFIFEKAIDLATFGRRKFDVRIYVIYGHVPYLYARSAPKANIVTNWSQGGRIEGRRFLKKALPPGKIKEIKDIARRSARVLGLNYAGIDILANEKLDKMYFLEAHSFPGYEKKFNLMKFLINKITHEV